MAIFTILFSILDHSAQISVPNNGSVFLPYLLFFQFLILVVVVFLNSYFFFLFYGFLGSGPEGGDVL